MIPPHVEYAAESLRVACQLSKEGKTDEAEAYLKKRKPRFEELKKEHDDARSQAKKSRDL